VAMQQRVATVEHAAEVLALALGGNGEMLGASTADGRITVWETAPRAARAR